MCRCRCLIHSLFGGIWLLRLRKVSKCLKSMLTGRGDRCLRERGRPFDVSARPFVPLAFLRDSVPLASDKLGEPGRFRLAPSEAFERDGSFFSARPDGVLVPFVDAPDLSPFATLALRSSSSLRSASSLSRSSSESSSSLDSEYGFESDSSSYSSLRSFLMSCFFIRFSRFFLCLSSSFNRFSSSS